MTLTARVQKFLTPPVSFSPEQKRFFSLTTIAFSLCIVVHLLYIPIFLWMELNVLTLHSIAAIPIWVITMWVSRGGHISTAYSLATLEFCVFIILVNFNIGWEIGAQYTIFAPAMMIFLFTFNRWVKTILAITMSLVVMLLYFFAERVGWTGNPATVNLLWIINVSLAFIAIFLMAGYQANLVRTAEQAMDRAHAISEALLNNVMPPVIADRLKQNEAVIADLFPEASILFADIVNFTQLSQNMTPNEVVQLLDDLFSRIDALVRKHKLEKIKTIGDAYMVAAGIPLQRSDHAEAIVAFAVELRKVLQEYNIETGQNLHFRIGINSGPVVAGVIGKLRFLYDMWGDSVNTASRMESHGIPDEIQVTEETHNLLTRRYEFEDRGMIDIKGKGKMRTYLLRLKEEDKIS